MSFTINGFAKTLITSESVCSYSSVNNRGSDTIVCIPLALNSFKFTADINDSWEVDPINKELFDSLSREYSMFFDDVANGDVIRRCVCFKIKPSDINKYDIKATNVYILTEHHSHKDVTYIVFDYLYRFFNTKMYLEDLFMLNPMASAAYGDIEIDVEVTDIAVFKDIVRSAFPTCRIHDRHDSDIVKVFLSSNDHNENSNTMREAHSYLVLSNVVKGIDIVHFDNTSEYRWLGLGRALYRALHS